MDGQIYAAAIEGKVKIFNATGLEEQKWVHKSSWTSHYSKINRNPLFTILETNIAPKTLGLEDEFPFGKASGQVLC